MPLEYLEEIESTNNFVKERLHDYKENFSGVYTFNQTQGRGQIGNHWLSEPDKNIALTFCLQADILDNLNVSFWTALILQQYIQEISHSHAAIKWPNDILINKKKVCGILIEKSNNTLIVGIGINVLQKDFHDLPKASSLFLQHKGDYNLHEICHNLIIQFKANEKPTH